MGITSLNTYSGQAGFYVIEDSELEECLDIPRGIYDIPMMLHSKYYTSTGNVTDISKERRSTFGDTPSVNGQILPYLVVEPRTYRFRMLNAAASRTFNLTLNADVNGANKLFHVIGSDAGFMSVPVETETLLIAMAERWEVSLSCWFPLETRGQADMCDSDATKDRGGFCGLCRSKLDYETNECFC